MAASVVRADYEQLAQIADIFDHQAALTRATLQSLSRHHESLEAGDWLGQGAQSFYAEMNSHVLPTLNRLILALEQAATTSRQINQVAQRAEAEAAAVFRNNGTASGSNLRTTTSPQGNVPASFIPMAGPGGGSGNTGSQSGRSGTSPSGPSAPVYNPNDPRFKRNPPGSGAYTQAEYEDWLRQHPKAYTQLVIGNQWKNEYSPAWLRAHGYFYAGSVLTGSAAIDDEVWLTNKGDGKVIRVRRTPQSHAPDTDQPVEVDLGLEEDLQEADGYVTDMEKEYKALDELAKGVRAVKGRPEYTARRAEAVKRYLDWIDRVKLDEDRIDELKRPYFQDLNNDLKGYDKLSDRQQKLRDLRGREFDLGDDKKVIPATPGQTITF